MKKAKIILTALTVFAVVGGALAFKAESRQGSLYCTTVQGSDCITTVTYKTTTDVVHGVNIYCADKSLGATGCDNVTAKQLVIQND